jgi:hypothetical protein
MYRGARTWVLHRDLLSRGQSARFDVGVGDRVIRAAENQGAILPRENSSAPDLILTELAFLTRREWRLSPIDQRKHRPPCGRQHFLPSGLPIREELPKLAFRTCDTRFYTGWVRWYRSVRKRPRRMDFRTPFPPMSAHVRECLYRLLSQAGKSTYEQA